MGNALQLIGMSVPKGLESPMKERKVIRITDIVRKENNMEEIMDNTNEISKCEEFRINLKEPCRVFWDGEIIECKYFVSDAPEFKKIDNQWYIMYPIRGTIGNGWLFPADITDEEVERISNLINKIIKSL